MTTTKCTGMYVREVDVFSAVYAQMNLYLRDSSHSISDCKQKTGQLRTSLSENYRVQQELIENPMLYYEKYVRGEITADEYRTAMDKNRKIAEVQKEIESEIAKYEQTYQRLCRMQKVLDKQLPLSEIIEEITAITVNSGRKVSCQWKTV